ncbi:hypothetical protein WG66_010131 [Moniliophthora roreri]|nr:hypothetical protein WG66_010131 [Moniliophthora roreri]
MFPPGPLAFHSRRWVQKRSDAPAWVKEEIDMDHRGIPTDSDERKVVRSCRGRFISNVGRELLPCYLGTTEVNDVETARFSIFSPFDVIARKLIPKHGAGRDRGI